MLAPAEWGAKHHLVEAEIRHKLSAGSGGGSFFDIEPIAIDSLWKLDSLTVEWVLADAIGDMWSMSESQAVLAGLTYAAYSGRSEPLLRTTVMGASPARQLIALRAVSYPISAMAEYQVVRIACDAAWLLRALKADTSYWPPPHPNWAYRQEELLYEAYRLLSNRRRVALKPYLAEVLSSEERLRLIDAQTRLR